MFNLSLTACSFHLRKTNSRGNTKIFNLNMPLTLQKEKLIQIRLWLFAAISLVDVREK